MPKLALRIAVSTALFAFVLSRVDMMTLLRTVVGTDPLPMALALFFSLAMVIADAAVWRSVLHSLGHRISLVTAMLYSIVGSFFGSLAPAAMGVDIFRAAQMRVLGVPTETAVRAVVSTRLVSFVSLLMVIATGMPIAFGYSLDTRDRLLLGSTCAIGLASLVGILVLDRLRNALPILQRFTVIATCADLSKDLIKALTSVHTPASLSYSSATHVLRVLTFAAIADAFQANISFAALYALVPIALLIAMIPITLASWGVREVSLIYFLGWVAVPGETALSISVTFGLLRLLVAAIGGVVWVFARSHHYNLKVAGSPDLRTIDIS